MLSLKSVGFASCTREAEIYKTVKCAVLTNSPWCLAVASRTSTERI